MSCSCDSNGNKDKQGCCQNGKPCGCGNKSGGKIWLAIALIVVVLVALNSALKDKKGEDSKVSDSLPSSQTSN